MSTLVIDRWIEFDSDEAKQIEYYSGVRKVVLAGLELEMIKPNKDGFLYMKKDNAPVHVELNGKLVGIKFSAKAMN